MGNRPDKSVSSWVVDATDLTVTSAQKTAHEIHGHGQSDLFEIGNGDGGTLGRLLADIARRPAIVAPARGGLAPPQK